MPFADPVMDAGQPCLDFKTFRREQAIGFKERLAETACGNRACLGRQAQLRLKLGYPGCRQTRYGGDSMRAIYALPLGVPRGS